MTTVLQFPNRILPGTGESCAQTQTTVAEFASAYSYYNCDSIRELVLFPSNRFWDIASYCGCPDAVAPRVCSVCDGDNVSASTADNRPLPPAAASALQLSFSVSFENHETSTPPSCGDWITLAPYVVDASMCEDLQVLQSFCCDNHNSDKDSDCSLCPTGEPPQSPFKVLPSFSSSTENPTTTCGSLHQALSSSKKEDASCSNLLQSLLPQNDGFINYDEFDLARYCDCPDSMMVPPLEEECAFCASKYDLVRPAAPVPVLASSETITCETVAYWARFVHSHSSSCTQLQASLRLGCCQSQQVCALCPAAGSIKHPERLVTSSFRGSSSTTTCSDLDFEMGFLGVQECQAFHASLATNTEIKLASWCGCTTAPPPVLCELCESPYYIVDHADMVIDNNDGSTMWTCYMLHQLSRHVTSQHVCDMELPALREDCCALAYPYNIPGYEEYDGAAAAPSVVFLHQVLVLGWMVVWCWMVASLSEWQLVGFCVWFLSL